MATLTPPEDWVDGPLVTAAIMNTRVRDKFREVQLTPSRGILGSWASSAQADATTTAYVNIPGLTAITVTADSPRTLQLIFSFIFSVTAAGLIPGVSATINGTTSVNAQQPIPAAGGPGQTRINAAGICVAVPAGTTTINAQVRLAYGSGTGSVVVGATLQLLDQGAS